MFDRVHRSQSEPESRLFLDSSTSLELLASLKSDSSQSWSIFVRKYTRLLRRWCHGWNVSPEDTEDVIQETLLELFRKINDYRAHPNKRFRAWLRKVAYYQYLRILAKNVRQAPSNSISEGKRGDHDDGRHLHSALVCQSYLQLIDLIADHELIEISCRRVAGRISSVNWTIFQRKELEGTPSKIVAEEFGITTNSVDVITSRVRGLIRIELKMLDPEG